MVLNKPGEGLIWGSIPFEVGAQVYATDASEYHGLIGVITEIRNGEDRETSNYLPDIYCSFQAPVLAYDRAELEKRFSELYQCPKKLEEIALDMAIMGPDMIVPMNVLDAQRDTVTIYHIYEDWAANGEQGSSVIATTDYDDAKRRFSRLLTEEMTDGCIPSNQDKAGFTVEEKKDYYSCWIDGEYWDFHYKLFITEETAVLTSKLATSIALEHHDAELREQFADQISSWEEVLDLTEEEMKELIQLPEIPERLRKAFDDDSCYWENFWNVISSEAYDIVMGFRRKIGKTSEPEGNVEFPPAAPREQDRPYELEVSKAEFDAVNAMAEKHRHLQLAGEKYIIRPFKDWFEILEEGRALRHAVGHFALNRYRHGFDYLFVMRKADDPETSFITLEFDRDGELEQARKLNNCLTTDPEEFAFIEAFRTKVHLPYIQDELRQEGPV